MKRGEIWTVAGGADYTGRPRPAVIVRDDAFDATLSVTICIFTSDPTEAPLFRLEVEPTAGNGLRSTSRLMIDKLTTVSKARLGARVGQLVAADVTRLNQALLVFLGLAGSSRPGRE